MNGTQPRRRHRCSSWILLVSIAMTGCTMNTPAPAGEGRHADAIVLRVIDGDTVAVKPSDALPATDENDTEHVVRVLGIDAPEMHYSDDKGPECGAQDATDHLDELLPAGTPVTLAYDPEAAETDRYGRTLAYVDLEDGTDAASLLASGGYVTAWYPQQEPEPERFATYENAVTTARDAGVGSWKACDLQGRQP